MILADSIIHDWTMAALVVEVLLAIVCAVWIVAAIKNQTNGLRQAIETLSKAAEKLEATVERIEKRQFDHELRLSLLERGISVRDLPGTHEHLHGAEG